LNSRFLAFWKLTGTSTLSSESNSLAPNCFKAHSLKFSYVPSLHSLQ
jgi:hypothetical protein